MQGSLFSDCNNFLKNEISLARNVKDKQNSRITVKNLEKIMTILKNYKKFEKGLFIYVGIDNEKNEIIKIIEPSSKCNKFVYKCMNKFLTDHAYDYIKTYEGSIIFVNGNKYYVYTHGSNGFEKIVYKSVDLGTRHNKGGQSQHRHERNYDIIKDYYISTILEIINDINNNIWIFGSQDIINKILSSTNKINKTIYNGGHLDFDADTIKDNNKWLSYIKCDKKQIDKEDKIFDNIITYLATDIDRLDFDVSNKDLMEYYVYNEDFKENFKEDFKEDCEDCENKKQIILTKKHKNYEKLCEFKYIGVKYNSCYDYDDYVEIKN